MKFMHDTDIETQRKYYAMLFAMPRDKRIDIGIRLSKLGREARMAAVVKEFPHYDEDQRRREYLRRLLTPEQFRVFYKEEA
jgi:hypothetical protein